MNGRRISGLAGGGEAGAPVDDRLNGDLLEGGPDQRHDPGPHGSRHVVGPVLGPPNHRRDDFS